MHDRLRQLHCCQVAESRVRDTIQQRPPIIRIRWMEAILLEGDIVEIVEKRLARHDSMMDSTHRSFG